MFGNCIKTLNHIDSVMVSMLASSAVGRGFKPRPSQIKDYEIGICCFSAKHARSVTEEKEQRLVGLESG